MYNRTGKNVFRISKEKNQSFDEENEIRVNNFLNENMYRIRPYESANTRRLNSNNFLTKPIENRHIVTIIKQFKKKASGKSGINKEILDNLPKEALDRLNTILNLALSMGYIMVLFVTSPLHESRLHWIHDPHPNQPPRVTPRQAVSRNNNDTVPRNNHNTVPRNTSTVNKSDAHA